MASFAGEAAAAEAAAPAPAAAAAAEDAGVADATKKMAAASLSGCAARFQEMMPKGADTEALKKGFHGKNVLFYIERTNNSNCVIYDAQLVKGADGKMALKADEAVKVYWIMYAKADKHEEGLNMIERNTAYGMTCTPKEGSPGHFTIQLKAVKDRPITVYLGDDGVLHARMLIGGKEGEVLHIFVEFKTSWGMPKVVSIDLYGRMADGTIAKETIKP